MSSYSTVTPQHISQFFYIWISTRLDAFPSILPLSFRGGYVNFGAWFMNNILLDQKKDKITK